jgi:cytochrome oxidase Cu insertion factor (SCO1/SenC/PrrC family)
MSLVLARPATVAVLAGLAMLLCLAVSASAADVKEGQAAPDVDLPATQISKVLPDAKDAKTLKLKDLQGKKNVVLYFYPKALTGG